MRGIECEEGVEFRSAEQEQDGGDESKHGSGDRARDDSGDDTQLPIEFLLKEAQRVNGKLTAYFSSLRRRGSKPVILFAVKRPGISTSGFSHEYCMHEYRALATTHDRSGQFYPQGRQVPLSFICYQHPDRNSLEVCFINTSK